MKNKIVISIGSLLACIASIILLIAAVGPPPILRNSMTTNQNVWEKSGSSMTWTGEVNVEGKTISTNGFIGSGRQVSGVSQFDKNGSFASGGSAKSGNLILGQITSTVANGTADSTFYAYSGLVRLPNGTLVAAYDDTGPKTIYIKTSSDFGATWSAASPVFTNANLVGDLNLGIDSINRLWLTYQINTAGIYSANYRIGSVNKSTGVITWGTQVTVASSFTYTTGTTSHVIELADGTLIWPIYGRNGSGNTDYWNSAILRSTDHGATWSHIAVANGFGTGNATTEGYSETDIVQKPDGTLIAIIRYDGAVEQFGVYYKSTSSDNGLTWTAPAQVLDITMVGRPCLVMLPSGGLFMLCRGANGYPTYQTSWDSGDTWSASVALYGGTDYYDAAVLQSGGSVAALIAHQTASGPAKASVNFFEFYDGTGLFPGGVIYGSLFRSLNSNLTMFDQTTTTLDIGSAATTLNLGANNSGTLTLRNATVSLPNGTLNLTRTNNVSDLQDGGVSYGTMSNTGANGGSPSYIGYNYRTKYGSTTQYGYLLFEASGAGTNDGRWLLGGFNGAAYATVLSVDNATGVANASGGFAVGAQTGISCTNKILLQDLTTNLMVWQGGILVSNITNYHD